MKRRNYRFTLLPSLLMLACAAGLMLTACTSNDDNPTADISTTPIDDTEEPGDYTGDGTFVAPDGLAWFMGHLVQTDSEGLLVGYVYGKPLDEADPTVLSVGVASAEEAEDIFRSFVADTLHVVSVAPGTVTYSPTDSLGRKQGEIYFTTGGDGTIARITFSDDIAQDLVSQVRFIDRTLWPDNAASVFEKGKVYFVRYVEVFDDPYAQIIPYWTEEENGSSYRRYVCLKPDAEGQPAMMFYCSNAVYMYDSKQSHGHNFKYDGDYGVWYKKSGDILLMARSVKNPKKGQPDSHPGYCSSDAALKEVSKMIYDDWDYWVQHYGSDRLVEGDIYWTSKWYSSDIVTYHQWSYIISKNKHDWFRTYTHFGHWNAIVMASPVFLDDAVKTAREWLGLSADAPDKGKTTNELGVVHYYWVERNTNFIKVPEDETLVAGAFYTK